MGPDHSITVMHSEGMTKPKIQRLVITFTLSNLQLDQYRRLGFGHESYLPGAADPLSSGYQPSGSIAIVATKVMKAGARGDSLRWSGEAVCDGTASLVLARHH